MQNGAVTLFIGELVIINLACVTSTVWSTEGKNFLHVYMVSGKYHEFYKAEANKFIEALLLYHDLQNKEK